jgi:DNA-binding winged helix-turn-helix (wHTH) protein/Flp pilus assembly protein TadD
MHPLARLPWSGHTSNVRKLLFSSYSVPSPDLPSGPSGLHCICIGEWRAELLTGRLVRNGEERNLEPKVMDLLFLLGSRPGVVLSREELIAQLWPGMVVGDDALARTIFKLRKALEDDPKSPRFIETLPKRGYRLIAEVSPSPPQRSRPAAPVNRRPLAMGFIALALLLATVGLVLGARYPSPSASSEALAHAKRYYNQFRRADNEAAILLYERVLAAEPRNATALAGLSSALLQRVLRWPSTGPAVPLGQPALTTALRSGWIDTVAGKQTLERAQSLAAIAVREKPGDPDVLRSYGLALSAQKRFVPARAVYVRALAQDPDAWAVLVNLAELKRLGGDHHGFVRDLEAAYLAIDRSDPDDAVRFSNWRAELGVQLGRAHQVAGRLGEAELWFRRVLEYAPLNSGAVQGLACVLSRGGDTARAGELCRASRLQNDAKTACMAC